MPHHLVFFYFCSINFLVKCPRGEKRRKLCYNLIKEISLPKNLEPLIKQPASPCLSTGLSLENSILCFALCELQKRFAINKCSFSSLNMLRKQSQHLYKDLSATSMTLWPQWYRPTSGSKNNFLLWPMWSFWIEITFFKRPAAFTSQIWENFSTQISKNNELWTIGEKIEIHKFILIKKRRKDLTTCSYIASEFNTFTKTDFHQRKVPLARTDSKRTLPAAEDPELTSKHMGSAGVGKSFCKYYSKD